MHDTVGIGKMIQRNQYMPGNSECYNHSEMMGQALCFSFCCLCHKHVCVCLIKCVSHMPCVVSESACMPCLCVGIVSGLSGHCFPDVVYSLLSDSLLPASVVSLHNLSEVWSTTFNWPALNWPDLTKPFRKIPEKTKSVLNKELNKATTQILSHIQTFYFLGIKKNIYLWLTSHFCENFRCFKMEFHGKVVFS